MGSKMEAAYEPKTWEQKLGYLVEEAGEMLAAAGKTLRWGRLSVNPELPPEQQETNIDWLMREIDDLERAIGYVRRGVLDGLTRVPTPSEPPAGSARGVPGTGAASERRAGPAKACCKQGAKLAEDWVERYKCPVHGWQDNPREAAGGAESEAEVDGAPPTASPIVAVGVPEGKPAGEHVCVAGCSHSPSKGRP